MRMFGRWVMLVIDLGFFLVGCIITGATHPHRRLGDFVFGTYVVSMSSVGRPIVDWMQGSAGPRCRQRSELRRARELDDTAGPGGCGRAGCDGSADACGDRAVLPVQTPPGTTPTTPGEWGAVARPAPVVRSPQWATPPADRQLRPSGCRYRRARLRGRRRPRSAKRIRPSRRRGRRRRGRREDGRRAGSDRRGRSRRRRTRPEARTPRSRPTRRPTPSRTPNRRPRRKPEPEAVDRDRSGARGRAGARGRSGRRRRFHLAVEAGGVRVEEPDAHRPTARKTTRGGTKRCRQATRRASRIR